MYICVFIYFIYIYRSPPPSLRYCLLQGLGARLVNVQLAAATEGSTVVT